MNRKEAQGPSLTRTDAGKLIDAVREMAGRGEVTLTMIQDLLEKHHVSIPVECHGQAHSEPNIDNCGMCAPQWGLLMRPTKVR